MVRWLPFLVLATGAGCVTGPPQTQLVRTDPFTQTGTPAAQAEGPLPSAATQEISVHVAAVGAKVLAANPQLEMRPVFVTVGSTVGAAPAEEIFHSGDRQVIVTETLARRCTTDGQLAALLCVELAKIAIEREQAREAASRLDDTGPPPEVPVGSETRGAFGAPDGTRAAELAMYDRKHHRGYHINPDPKIQARAYLTRAGYAAGDLDAAAPLLRSAEQHVTLEKQMNR